MTKLNIINKKMTMIMYKHIFFQPTLLILSSKTTLPPLSRYLIMIEHYRLHAWLVGTIFCLSCIRSMYYAPIILHFLCDFINTLNEKRRPERNRLSHIVSILYLSLNLLSNLSHGPL